MLCPKCKNPIDDTATTCEWCGAKLSVANREAAEPVFADAADVENNRREFGRPEDAAPKKDGAIGIAAFLFGIAGILLITIPPAIVMGVMGWRRGIKHRKLAIAGFVLGCIWLVLSIIAITSEL
jgi:hypothetical protein